MSKPAAPTTMQQASPAPQTASMQQPPAQGLVLRPPVPGAHAAEKRKMPSLLERITGAYSGVMNGQPEQGSEEGSQSGGNTSTGSFHSGLRAERAVENPSQGKLNIDSPAAPRANAEEDLDIPAFLRRQAN